MTLLEGEELQRLWQLVSDLSSQLSANQAQCKALQEQADELKGQALHTGTGFALRRFNVDISKEKFESDLERLNAYLVQENQTLAHENKQSNQLLREYESMLETIMGKFRAFSHATQQHTLALTEHYESLLANNAHEVERGELHQNTALSEHLAHLGGLVRSALRELDGEVADDGLSEDVEMDDEGSNGSEKVPEIAAEQSVRRKSTRTDPFEAEGYHVGSPSGGPARVHIAIPDHIKPSSSSGSSSSSSAVGSSASKTKKKRQGYGSSRTRDPRWYGTGGYTGVAGDPDAEIAERALEAQIEDERLRHENTVLRELLRVSSEFSPELAEYFGMDPPPPPPAGGWGALSAKLSLGKPRGARQSEDEQMSHDSQRTETSTKLAGSSIATSQEEEDVAASAESEHKSPGRPVETAAVSSTLSPSARNIGDAVVAANHGVVVDHVTSGAGGPPQLEHETARDIDVQSSLEQPRSGTVVTESIDEPVPPSTGAAPVVAPIEAAAKMEPPSASIPILSPSSPSSPPLVPVPLDTEAMNELRDSDDKSKDSSTAEGASPRDVIEEQPRSLAGKNSTTLATEEEQGDGDVESSEDTREHLLDRAEEELNRASGAIDTLDSSDAD